MNTKEDFKNYNLEAFIGQGIDSLVFEAVENKTNQSALLKLINKDLIENLTGRNSEEFCIKFSDFLHVEHENIVKYKNIGIYKKFVYVVMENNRGVSLREIMRIFPRINNSMFFNIIRCCLSGLQELYERNLIHGNIKPENIILDKKDIVRLTDYGIPKGDFYKKITTVKLSNSLYISPEELAANVYNIKSDLYCLGMIFYEIITRYFSNGFDRKKHIHKNIDIYSIDNFSLDFKDWLARILNKDPLKRYRSPKEALEELNKFIKKDFLSSKLEKEDIYPCEKKELVLYSTKKKNLVKIKAGRGSSTKIRKGKRDFRLSKIRGRENCQNKELERKEEK